MVTPTGIQQVGKDLGACHPGAWKCADPIDIGTGNVFEQAVDYQTAGQNQLSFSRYYNSRSYVNPATMNGGGYYFPLSNWLTNYDRYLFVGSGYAVIQRQDGKTFLFTYNNGAWTTDSDLDYSLVSGPGGSYSLTCPDDSVEEYAPNQTGPQGITYLQQITYRNGYNQSFLYGSVPFNTSVIVLIKVQDSYNRTLTLNYNQNATLASVVTPDNTTIDYGYNSSNQLTTVTYPTSPTSTITYNYGENSAPATALTSIKDEDGNIYETWTYDANSRGLTNFQGGSSLNANYTSVAYNDTNGSRTVQTGPTCPTSNCVTDTYTFTTYQNAPKVTQISRAATSTTAAATESFGYDNNGYLDSFTDWNGNNTMYTNNPNGMPTSIIEATNSSSVERSTSITYDTGSVNNPPLPHSPLTITTAGLASGFPSDSPETIAFTYDNSGDVLTKTLTDTTPTNRQPYSTNGQTRTWTYTWSNFLLATVKSPNGNTTTFGYDSTGALTSITNAKSQVTTITSHTAGGQPKTIVDPNGSTNGTTTTLTYDPRQRLTSKAVATANNGTETTTYTLDAAGNLTKLTLADNSYISYVYDTAHRVTKATNALGEYQTYTLDALGDRTQVNTYRSSGSVWRQQALTFDALGREIKYVGGTNNYLDQTTYAYDADGNLVTITDGNNHATTRVFDALNRLSKSTDANSGVTQFAYDAHDRTTSVTDANNNATAYVYDGFGDNIQQASPDTGTTVYYYDGDANLTSKKDALSVTTTFTYDALDRVTSRTGTQWAYFGYDSNNWNPGSTIGRLSWVDDPTGYMYFAYDQFGNASHRQHQTQSGTVVNDIWISHDLVNRESAYSYPSGLYVAFNRDAAGQVTTISTCWTQQNCGTVESASYAAFYGPLDYESFGNGFSVNKYVEGDYRPLFLLMQTSGQTSNVMNGQVYLDAANNVTGFSDTVNAYNNQSFGFDVINRLTSATSGAGGYGSLAWQYDKLGNLSSQTVNSSTTTYGYTSGSNRLASITHGGTINVTTDADGNITSIPPADQTGTAATFAYNSGNRLISVTGSPLAITSNLYDAFGERLSKQEPGSNPNTYVYDLDGHLIEENDNGSVTDYLYNNDVLVGLWVPSTSKLYYVHTDWLGKPLFVTDSNQNIAWSTTYQPYGTTGLVVGSVTQNVRLPGQFSDTETGFYYNMNRDYMPNLGRYLEADPIGLAGGINPYRYAKANPGRFTDRFGLLYCDVREENAMQAAGFPRSYGCWEDSHPTPQDVSKTIGNVGDISSAAGGLDLLAPPPFNAPAAYLIIGGACAKVTSWLVDPKPAQSLLDYVTSFATARLPEGTDAVADLAKGKLLDRLFEGTGQYVPTQQDVQEIQNLINQYNAAHYHFPPNADNTD